jgi:hypothetical protein
VHDGTGPSKPDSRVEGVGLIDLLATLSAVAPEIIARELFRVPGR